MLLTYVWDVPGSNLGRDADFPDCFEMDNDGSKYPCTMEYAFHSKYILWNFAHLVGLVLLQIQIYCYKANCITDTVIHS
jgi:hypothetical protein